MGLYIYDVVPEDEVNKHKVLSKDEVKDSKDFEKLKVVHEKAIDTLKDAEKALERCNAFVVYDYDWLQEKINDVLWDDMHREE